MTVLLMYTRRECGLCEEMAKAIEEGARGFAVRFSMIDVDSETALARRYGGEVPVLWINGRKYAKYRVSAARLRLTLLREALRTGLPD